MVRDCKARDAIVPSNLAGTVQILWVILIGPVAGVIAKFITPGENEPMGSSSPRYLEFMEPWLQRTSDKLSVGTDQIRALIE
jgi:hypothetical protein